MAMAAMSLLPPPHLLRISPDAPSLAASSTSTSNEAPSSGASSTGPSPTDMVPSPPGAVGGTHGVQVGGENGDSYSYNVGVSLTCAACNEIYKNPKVLSSCFHTFCEECLAKAQEAPDKIVCPSCRTPSFVSLDGVKGLTTDFAITNLLEQRMLTDCSASFTCTSCKTASNAVGDNGAAEMTTSRAVVAHCHECNAMLCATCYQSHQRMIIFASHQVVPVGPRHVGQPPTKISKWLKCHRHRSLNLDRYCQTCTRPTCKDCATMNHPGHDCFDLSDAAPGVVRRMIEMTQYAIRKTTELRGAMKNIEQSCIRLKKEYGETRDQINETYNYFSTVLLEQQQHSLRKLDVAYNDKEVILGHTAQEMQQKIDKAKDCCEFVNKLVTHSSPSETLECHNMIMSRLEEILRYKSTVGDSPMVYGLKFITHREKIQAAVTNSFGEVHEQYNSSTTSATQSGGQVSEELMESLISAMQGQNNVGFQSLHNAGLSHSNGLNVGDLSLLRHRQSDQQSGSGSLMKYQGGASAFQPNYQGGASGGYQGGASSYQRDTTGYQGGSSSSSTYQGINYPMENSVNAYQRSSVNALAMAMNSASSAASYRNTGANSMGSPLSHIGSLSQYDNWGSSSLDDETKGDIFSSAGMFNAGDVGEAPKSAKEERAPQKSQITRVKMVYTHKFGEFGNQEGQFTEPSGVAVNINGDILVADTNNHRIQVFSPSGDFKYHFGHHGKREGQLLYPNRVVVCKLSGNVIVTERAPTHQVQVFAQDGSYIRKFGSQKLQHPRGIAVDNLGRIIIVECKVMRIIIFDGNGNELSKFGCTKHLEFPNGVVVNDKEEIFISDNRSHCVKVFSYDGAYLRQIGQEGLTNYPIGVGINHDGHVIIADNHNNFNITAFTQDGQMIAAMESRVKHAQCFDVALSSDGSIVLASRDYRIYVYHFDKLMCGGAPTPLPSRMGGLPMLGSSSPNMFGAPSPSLFSAASNSQFSGIGNNQFSGIGSNQFSGAGNNPFSGAGNNTFSGLTHNQFSAAGLDQFGGASKNSASMLPSSSAMSSFETSRLPDMFGGMNRQQDRQQDMFRQPETNLLSEMNRQSVLNRPSEISNWFGQQRNY